jgi:signal transduction histidine kinase
MPVNTRAGGPDEIGDRPRLFGNAVKFTCEKEITLECGLRNGDLKTAFDTAQINDPESGREEVVLQFSVEDSGIGIPREKQGSIFESFTQADSSTTREYGDRGDSEMGR